MELSVAQQLKAAFSISLAIVRTYPAAVHDQAGWRSGELGLLQMPRAKNAGSLSDYFCP